MGISSPRASDVAFSATHTYLMPELQRDLVWTVEQGVSLMDSLSRGFSIGTIQLWELRDNEPVKLRTASNKVAKSGSLLVIDGQQRCTALAAMCTVGTPDWVVSPSELKRFNLMRSRVCVAVDTFEIADVPMIRQKPGTGWLPIHKLCTASNDDLPKLIASAFPSGVGDSVIQIAQAKLEMFRAKLLSHDIAVETRSLSLGEAVESFSRLNSKGISLSQGDLVVAAFAFHSPGFAGDQLKPYVEMLAERGLADGSKVKIQDALLRSVLTHLQLKVGRTPAVRFSSVDFNGLQMDKIVEEWPKIRTAWDKTLEYFDQRGIDSSAIRGLNELAPLVMLALKFQDFAAVDDDRMARAWIYMRRADRYAKQSTDAHAADADLLTCATLDEALNLLVLRTTETRWKKFKSAVPRYTVQELLEPVPEEKLTTGIYGHAYALMLGPDGRTDPLSGVQLRFTKSRKGRAKGAGSDSEWHHMMPKQLVKQISTVPPTWLNSMANLSFVSAETNNTWKVKAPGVYLDGIDPKRLTAQGFNLAVKVTDLASAEAFVLERAQWLCDKLNEMLIAAEAAAGISPATAGSTEDTDVELEDDVDLDDLYESDEEDPDDDSDAEDSDHLLGEDNVSDPVQVFDALAI